MSPIETPAPPTAEASANETVTAARITEDDLTILQKSLSGIAREHEVDVLGWYQALPRLLGEGEEGRFALMYEGQVVSVWDTHGDAIQAGYEKWGPGRNFWAGEIKQRELEKLQRFLAQERAKQCPK